MAYYIWYLCHRGLPALPPVPRGRDPVAPEGEGPALPKTHAICWLSAIIHLSLSLSLYIYIYIYM